MNAGIFPFLHLFLHYYCCQPTTGQDTQPLTSPVFKSIARWPPYRIKLFRRTAQKTLSFNSLHSSRNPSVPATFHQLTHLPSDFQRLASTAATSPIMYQQNHKLCKRFIHQSSSKTPGQQQRKSDRGSPYSTSHLPISGLGRHGCLPQYVSASIAS